MSKSALKKDEYKRDDYVYLAKIYQTAEKFEDMAKFINEFVKENSDLSHEERNILSVGYKNYISNKRLSWKFLNLMEKNSEEKTGLELTYIKEVKSRIEGEMTNIINEFQKLIDDYLLPNSKDYLTSIFYLKLKGDYYRYQCEYSFGIDFDNACELAEQAYIEADDTIKRENISIGNSIVLSLYLNFSVFYYDIKNIKNKAYDIAKNTYDSAMKIADGLIKIKANESLAIIQLLKENITLWDNQKIEEEKKENDF